MLHTKQTNCTKQTDVLYHIGYYNTKQFGMLLTDITLCKSPACPLLFSVVTQVLVVVVAFTSIIRCSVSPPSSSCITLTQPAMGGDTLPRCLPCTFYVLGSQCIPVLPAYIYITGTMYSYIHPPFVLVRHCKSSYCKSNYDVIDYFACALSTFGSTVLITFSYHIHWQNITVTSC